MLLAGRLDLVTDQYAQFSRSWPLRYKETGDPVVGLDVASARLRWVDDAGTAHDIAVTFDAFTVEFRFDVPGTAMSQAGSFLYDVRILPSTGAANAWYLLRGCLTVRPAIGSVA